MELGFFLVAHVLSGHTVMKTYIRYQLLHTIGYMHFHYNYKNVKMVVLIIASVIKLFLHSSN